MSISDMNQEDSLLCDKYNLFEYGFIQLITMPNGYQFAGNDIEDSILQELKRSGAIIKTLTELGE